MSNELARKDNRPLLARMADRFGVDLIGGDTTRGPLTLCVTAFGELAAGTAIRRSGARPGDDIWVSGQPGRAALGLASLLGQVVTNDTGRAGFVAALEMPEPRVALGIALRGGKPRDEVLKGAGLNAYAGKRARKGKAVEGMKAQRVVPAG